MIKLALRYAALGKRERLVGSRSNDDTLMGVVGCLQWQCSVVMTELWYRFDSRLRVAFTRRTVDLLPFHASPRIEKFGMAALP